MAKEESTLIIIKPDGILKSLTGNIITSLSSTKLRIVGAKVMKVSKEFAEQHYFELKGGLIQKFGEAEGTDIFNSTLDFKAPLFLR